MKLRPRTLWRVPVFCIIASWLSYYITIYGGFLYVVRTTGADGAVGGLCGSASVPRSFRGYFSWRYCCSGGLWAFRSMTKLEIARVGGPDFCGVSGGAPAAAVPAGLSACLKRLAGPIPALDWNPSSLLLRLMNLHLALAVSAFAPFLFVPFGRRQKD